MSNPLVTPRSEFVKVQVERSARLVEVHFRDHRGRGLHLRLAPKHAAALAVFLAQPYDATQGAAPEFLLPGGLNDDFQR